MVQARKIELAAVQTQELQQVRDHAAQPYLRVRAAGILKVAQGRSIRWVAKYGLLKPVHPDRLREWINRYLTEGADGLRVRAGRGRKPVFSPSAREHRNGSTRSAGHPLSLTSSLRAGAESLDACWAARGGELVKGQGQTH